MNTFLFRCLAVCALVGVNIATLLAQKAKLSGVILGGDKNEPVYAATLQLINAKGEFVSGTVSDYNADADKEGYYFLEVEAGTYTLKLTHVQYLAQEAQITLAAGESRELNFTMQEGSMITEVVVTEGRNPKILAQSSISTATVSPQLIENTNSTKVDEVVNKVPGVSVVDGQANIRGGSGYSYGAGSRVLLLVDDMPFLQPDAGFPNWRDMPVENIDQIEVLKGAGSALYGSSALNGIIHIRTAYATSKPLTKIALFQTSYMTPKRENTAWWKNDSIATYDYDAATNKGSYEKPALLKGRDGYRKPMEAGLQFAHRRKFGEKLFWTMGGNLYYFDSYRAGEYERKARFNSNLQYRLNKKTQMGINLNFNGGQSGSFFIWGNTLFADSISTAIYTPLANTITESKILRYNIDPYFTTFDKFNGRHRVQTRYYHINNKNGTNQSNQSDLLYGEYQYSKTIKSLDDLGVVAGAVGQTTFSKSQLFGNASYTLSNLAAYVQAEKGFMKDADGNNRLILSAGARIERNTINSPDSVLVSPVVGKVINPDPKSQQVKPVFRAGANYRAAKATFVRASWGQGYRYPTIAERYISTVVGSGTSGLEIRANPNLKAETGWSAEIGVMQGFQIPIKTAAGKPTWQGFIDASLFWSEYQNMMEFTFKGGAYDPNLFPLYFSSVNIGNTNTKGGEVSVMGQGHIGKTKVNLMSGYTYIDPRFKNFDTLQQKLSSYDKNELKYRSRHMLKFDAEAFFLKEALSVGISYNYTSSMKAIDRAFEDLAVYDPNFTVDMFGIGMYRRSFNSGEFHDVSARIGYRYSVKGAENKELYGIKLSLVGKNLLNQEYMIRPALAGAPRSITARIDVDF